METVVEVMFFIRRLYLYFIAQNDTKSGVCL